jgi:hypothetical protein
MPIVIVKGARMLLKAIVAIGLSTAFSASFAQGLQFSPQGTGFPSLDNSVTEIARTDSISTLEIPGFQDRSALGSRWMMCVYTNLAMIRHKNFLVTAYLREGDTVRLGFPESKDSDELEKLGPEFLGLDAPKQIMSVATMRIFCSQLGYKFVYLPVSGIN